MADPYRKPSAGDPPKRSARFDSELVDVVLWAKRQMAASGAGGSRSSADAGIIEIRNDTNEAVGEFGILGINDVVFTPTDDEDSFKTSLLFSGIAPTLADHDGLFCVAQEPIDAGEIGKARVAGRTRVQVQVTAGLEWYGYADVTNSNTAVLTLLPAGAAQVLWKEDSNTNTTVWADVRLGAPPGNVTARVKLDETLNTASSAAASFWDGDPLADTGNDAEVCDGDANWHLMDTNGSFDANTAAVVTWMPVSRTWQLVSAACNTA